MTTVTAGSMRAPSSAAVKDGARLVVKTAASSLWGVVRWCVRHFRWTFALALVAVIGHQVGSSGWMVFAVLAVVVPAIVDHWWARLAPVGHERWAAGPWRRIAMRWWWRRTWPSMSQAVDLGRSVQRKDRRTGQQVTRWRPARCRVRASTTTLTVRMRVPAGRSVRQVLETAEALGAMSAAASVTATRESMSVAVIRLCMAGVLDVPRFSAEPTPSSKPVVLGRYEDGADFTWDPLRDAHMGMQGQTRSGKSYGTQTILSALARRPDVVVVGCDPSGILLGPWMQGRGGSWVSTGTAQMTKHGEVMAALVREMDERIARLTMRGLDKLGEFDCHTPALVAVFEEWPGLLAAAKADDEVQGRKGSDRVAPALERGMGRLVRESAKVGFAVVVLAQRMSATALAGDDRANLPNRITLRVDNGDSVRMLHDGASVDVEEVRSFAPGVCLAETPSRGLTRVRMDATDYRTYCRRVSEGIEAMAQIGGWSAPGTSPRPTDGLSIVEDGESDAA